jgi:hypothetical protein
MTKRRLLIVLFALIGAVVGAGFGALAAPSADRYEASANVALLPAPNLTTDQSSTFWDVLTRGQISRTAAIVYGDSRWLQAAANAAGIPQSELTVTAAALPETTIVSVTVTAKSAAAAETALTTVLNTAAPEVSSVTAPFVAKVLWPPQDSSYPVPVPSRLQFAAAGALAGLLAGGSIAWFVARRRDTVPPLEDEPDNGRRHRARHPS